MEGSADPRQRGRKMFWFEVAVALVLGLTALASAWSAYRSTVVRDDADAATSHGIRSTELSAVYYVHSDQIRSRDQALFLQYEAALRAHDRSRATYVKSVLMRPTLRAQVDWWEDQEPGRYPSPFVEQNPRLKPVFRTAASQLRERSLVLFADAETLSSDANRYELITVILSVTLLLVGVAGVMPGFRFRLALLVIGSAFLIGSLVEVGRLTSRGSHFRCDRLARIEGGCGSTRIEGG